jgi:hypothetical protein
MRDNASGLPESDDPSHPGSATTTPPLAALSPSHPPEAEGDSPNSLDTQETSVIDAFMRESPAKVLPWEEQLKAVIGTPNAAVRFRHGGWWSIRERVKASLFRLRESDSRIMAFTGCGGGSWIEHCVADPSRLRVRQNNCHDKLCTPCANARSAKIREALIAQMAGRPATFVTLTLCGKNEPLKDLVDKLLKSFRALRLHPTWADRVSGGAAIMEIKYSDKAKRWHPHLHIICEAKFLPQQELCDAWRSITKDSFIVDIRRVQNAEIAGSYVAKYASKPLNTSFCSMPKLLDEAVTALKGRRLVLCFGTWYGTPLSEMEDVDLADDLVDAGEWSMVYSLHEILQRAASADAEAIAIIKACGLESRWRLWLEYPKDTS